MRAAWRTGLAAIGLSALLVTACAVRTHEATPVGKLTFGRPFSPFSLPMTVVGAGEPDERQQAALDYVMRRIQTSPEEERGLAYADCGIAAIFANDLATARLALDRTLTVATAATAGGKREQNAKSLFGAEQEKLFKGEPHERVVTLLYRGLLYMADGEVDNAQACFRAGALQDAMAQTKSARVDWLTPDLLLLVCQKLLDDAQAEDWQNYVARQYGSRLPPGWNENEGSPVVVLVAVGNPPDKFTSEQTGGVLSYIPLRSRASSVDISLGGEPVILERPADDCYEQARQRGRRTMDDVLKRKAATQGVTKAAAGCCMLGGAMLGGNEGAMVQLSAQMLEVVADQMKILADIRLMRTVPDRFYLYVGAAKARDAWVTVKVRDGDDQVLALGTVPIKTRPGRPTVVLARFPY